MQCVADNAVMRGVGCEVGWGSGGEIVKEGRGCSRRDHVGLVVGGDGAWMCVGRIGRIS